MEAKLKINEIQIIKKSDNYSYYNYSVTYNMNIFYLDLLSKTSNNLILKCISIIIQYLYIISFILDTNVSFIIII